MMRLLGASVILIITANANAEVEANCNAVLSGKVTCEFSNTGQKKDSACVMMTVTRTHETKLYSIPYYGGEGTVLSTDKVCSGLVEPQDIRERAPNVTWSVDGQSVTPYDFCRSNNPWFTPNDLCTMETVPIPPG